MAKMHDVDESCFSVYPIFARDEKSCIPTVIHSLRKVKGKIKVVRSLAEADKLEQGDIMVCQYTDIGWSPYFAIIG